MPESGGLSSKATSHEVHNITQSSKHFKYIRWLWFASKKQIHPARIFELISNIPNISLPDPVTPTSARWPLASLGRAKAKGGLVLWGNNITQSSKHFKYLGWLWLVSKKHNFVIFKMSTCKIQPRLEKQDWQVTTDSDSLGGIVQYFNDIHQNKPRFNINIHNLSTKWQILAAPGRHPKYFYANPIHTS